MLVVLPDEFDPEVFVDFFNEKKTTNKKRKIPASVTADLKVLAQRGRVMEEDGRVHDYYELYNALGPLSVYNGETTEGSGYIEIIKPTFFAKITKIKTEYTVDLMRDSATKIREKRERMKLKYQHIDPYGEEEWDDDEESIPEKLVKKYNSFLNEDY
jgi:hypothetical protein